ncbi:hypothetical protein [Yaniella sp.]|uniref:hypothetical protein n=1 Tax=Yaniella sp. TaxID=2773929 RepID=UPI003462D394
MYIFEFANGQRYIGQTINFAGRFPVHIRGKDHHEPWEDMAKLQTAKSLTWASRSPCESRGRKPATRQFPMPHTRSLRRHRGRSTQAGCL